MATVLTHPDLPASALRRLAAKGVAPLVFPPAIIEEFEVMSQEKNS